MKHEHESAHLFLMVREMQERKACQTVQNGGTMPLKYHGNHNKCYSAKKLDTRRKIASNKIDGQKRKLISYLVKF